ncbi:MAG TPA: SigB/SigF/SigG family RNA polymerase sigma factor [Mycobacteriales bacterium]|nr:SigB/SigF/SigG family RNA polymerase sigma factor [Mycobacteriales bacterium]
MTALATPPDLEIATAVPVATRPPNPSRERARVLFARLAELPPESPERDRIRAELVEQHLPLVRYFARRYANRGEPMDDLLQAGSLGLVKAVDRFEPERGLEFSTYAAPTILGEIRRHFRDRTWAVHVHRGLQELTAEITRYAAELTQELNRAPSVAELVARSGRSEEKVLEALDCAAAYTADSLETPMGEDRTLGDSLGGEDTALLDVELHESLGPALATLAPRERRILQLRFYGNQTQSQIAAQLGISQMHVSRLLAKTLASLREQLLA